MTQTTTSKLRVVAKADKAEVYIYEDIGDDGWAVGLSAKKFSEEMKAAKNASEIKVYINSGGGSVFEGISIYNQLKRHKAKVVVDIDGLAASIASLIAMAGDEIYMAENALMMIHKPWGAAFGTSEEMRHYADTLDKVESTLIDTYAKRSGISQNTMSDLLAAETWLNADEALEAGLVDAVTEPKRMAAHVDLHKFGFKNVPKELPSAVYTVEPVYPNRRRYEEKLKYL